MKINMNDPVTVTLTTYGAQTWNARYNGISIPVEHRPKPSHTGDVITAQLWDLMHVFGPGIHMGMLEVPFLHNAMDINNAENIGYYKAKMEAADRQLANAIRERNETFDAGLAQINDLRHTNITLQKKLADAIRERDQYKAACEMATALRPVVDAAQKLVASKGRHHTELNYKALVAALEKAHGN